jgi:hypothetical protein
MADGIEDGTPNITVTLLITLTANNSFGSDLKLLQIHSAGQLHYLSCH